MFRNVRKVAVVLALFHPFRGMFGFAPYPSEYAPRMFGFAPSIPGIGGLLQLCSNTRIALNPDEKRLVIFSVASHLIGE